MINMVAISGRKNSFFSSRMGDIFTLGQARPEERLYADAKAAVAQWDGLVNRLNYIANPSVAAQIAADAGVTAPSNQDKGQYARDGVNRNLVEAESRGMPPIYDVFRRGDVQNRVARLESYLSSFRRAVEDAEATYGLARTITNTIYTPGAAGAPAAIPSWVLPVGAAVIGIGLLGALGVIKL